MSPEVRALLPTSREDALSGLVRQYSAASIL